MLASSNRSSGGEIQRAGTKTRARGAIKSQTAKEAIGSMIESGIANMQSLESKSSPKPKAAATKTKEDLEKKEMTKNIKSFLEEIILGSLGFVLHFLNQIENIPDHQMLAQAAR